MTVDVTNIPVVSCLLLVPVQRAIHNVETSHYSLFEPNYATLHVRRSFNLYANSHPDSGDSCNLNMGAY